MAPEVKPCPFCGSNEVTLWINGDFVKCIECGAYAPALAAWNRRPDDWVSVEERLPELGVVVLIAVAGERGPLLGEWTGTMHDGRPNWRVVPSYSPYYLCNYATHWRPLPELPDLPDERQGENV